VGCDAHGLTTSCSGRVQARLLAPWTGMRTSHGGWGPGQERRATDGDRGRLGPACSPLRDPLVCTDADDGASEIKCWR
jgi:hypothetical protein